MNTKEPGYYRDLLENIERTSLTRIGKFLEPRYDHKDEYDFAVMDDEVPNPSFELTDSITDEYDLNECIVTLKKVAYYYMSPGRRKQLAYNRYNPELLAEFEVFLPNGNNLKLSQELRDIVVPKIVSYGIPKIKDALKFAGIGPELYENIDMQYDKEESKFSTYTIFFYNKNAEVNAKFDSLIGKWFRYQESLKDLSQ